MMTGMKEGIKMKKIRGNKMKKQISKNCSLMIVLVTVAVILTGLFSWPALRPAKAAGIQFNEFQITSNTASQENPDIDGYNIVYQDNRNGNWDIYMYTLQGTFVPETRITTNPANQINPRISGDKIVYQDDRNGNWDIYMYDLTTQTETQITNNPSSQEYPKVDGNRIVWQDNRNGNWDIYMYDLSTQTERRVTTSGSNTSPAISGDRIAYVKDGNVYYFDLSSGNEVRLTWYDPRFFRPENIATYGSYVVWDFMMDPVLVHVTTAGPHEEWHPYTGMRFEVCPDIAELQPGVYYIVYQANVYQEGGSYWNNWNIYLYRYDSNSNTGTEYQVAPMSSNQIRPKVSGGRIVYMDNRNGNWDIYMTMVSYGYKSPRPPTPADAIEMIQGIQSIIADPAQIPTSDIKGANSKVTENRREALLNKLDAVIASIQAAADSTHPASRTAHYKIAIQQLKSIVDKTDGCALRGTPDTTRTDFTPDWIITCASQELIEPPIRDSMTMLQTLLQQS
jgi:TolB protein